MSQEGKKPIGQKLLSFFWAAPGTSLKTNFVVPVAQEVNSLRAHNILFV